MPRRFYPPYVRDTRTVSAELNRLRLLLVQSRRINRRFVTGAAKAENYYMYSIVERCKHVKSQATTVYFRLGKLR